MADGNDVAEGEGLAGGAPPPQQEGFFDHRVSFINHAGDPSSPLEMVMPIGFFDPSNALFHPFGTGVFVSHVGLVCTARHVFQFEPRFLESMSHLSPDSYPAIYQFYDDHSAGVRPIIAVHGHPRFDVAVARVEPVHHRTTGEAFSNKEMALTTDVMPIGTRVHQYSYPDPVIFDQPEGPQLLMIPLHTEGRIIDWLPKGMGSLFPSPCYVIEGYIGAGSSGGPVMDETGRVFAISSRGNAAADYYYAIPVQAIADIVISSVILSTPPVIAGPTIREMVTRGLVSFVERVDESG
ncbi:serine protease [Sphingomonas sp.]|uniref:S1 family peptidase n=1 Tax=Sphingomonas sp. TaxID=28214 RepID=UPI0017AB92D0|nr:serine protease [Sphingomonas sp.]MBA4760891.1 trypsin-like peptidase domain-containing protein [Sphingomonas sp.]